MEICSLLSVMGETLTYVRLLIDDIDEHVLSVVERGATIEEVITVLKHAASTANSLVDGVCTGVPFVYGKVCGGDIDVATCAVVGQIMTDTQINVMYPFSMWKEWVDRSVGKGVFWEWYWMVNHFFSKTIKNEVKNVLLKEMDGM